MRIIGLAEFLAMPAGTVFAKYQPCVFEDLSIKGDTLSAHDFISTSLGQPHVSTGSDEEIDTLERMRITGTDEPVVLDLYGRDGCFDPDQLFAVWSSADVDRLVDQLHLSRKVGIPTAE